MDPTGRDHETDLTGLEKTLARLRPSAVALDRDRLLFEAGRASARSELRGRVGTLTAAVLALVVVGLGGLLVRERAARVGLESRLASLAPATNLANPPALAVIEPGPANRFSRDSYVILSRSILAGGMDSLSSEPPGPPTGARSGDSISTQEPLRVRGPGRALEL